MNCGYFSVRARKKELLRQIKEYAIDLAKFCGSSDDELLDTLPMAYFSNIFQGRNMIEEGEQLLRETLQKAILYMSDYKSLKEVIEE